MVISKNAPLSVFFKNKQAKPNLLPPCLQEEFGIDPTSELDPAY